MIAHVRRARVPETHGTASHQCLLQHPNIASPAPCPSHLLRPNPNLPTPRPLRARPRLPNPHSPTSNQPPRLQILLHHALHAPNILPRQPQIIKPGSPPPLLRPLHDLHPLNIRTEDLDPHLGAHSPDFVSEQDTSVDAATADGETDASEGVPGFEGREEDVSGAGHVGVGAVEEALAGGGRVEGCEVGGCYGGDGEGVETAGGGGRGIGFYALWGGCKGRC